MKLRLSVPNLKRDLDHWIQPLDTASGEINRRVKCQTIRPLAEKFSFG
jgi:hypothetical protein